MRIRYSWGFLLTLPAILMLPAASVPESKAPARPAASLVLISLDTARADHFHCYGYSLPTTPVLDRLASEGILFENAFTQAVNTGPAHVSLLTGLSPNGHGVRANGVPLSYDFPTLTTYLESAGYRTGAFISGYTMMAAQTGLDRGFEVFDDKLKGAERKASETVDRALAWLKGLPPDKPYFLFVHLFDPHGKYDPPAGFAEKFRSGKYEPIARLDSIPEYQRLELPGGGFSRDPLDYISRYDGELAYADSQIFRLLSQVGPSPIVVVTADHGETLVDRDYYFSHGARLNDEALRIPLIVRVPEPAMKGKRVKGLAQLVDVLPTVLSALKQPVPRRLAGRNLLPFARLGVIPAGTEVFSEARAVPQSVGGRLLNFSPKTVISAIRDDRFKLIVYPTTPNPAFELFDLEKDPGERHGVTGAEQARASRLYSGLDLYLSSGRLPSPPEPDEETKKKLRALGYLD
ncbi:MAG TPA: sulfatase [Candidatus Polarisedimenticolia bacterium]|nr:sulfatase [Candidatus Polarisedimenticolia bacterium]